jgi:hypothetical protein
VNYTKDLIVLVADKDMEKAVSGLLNRPKELGIRPISFDTQIETGHDPKVFISAHITLQPIIRQYNYSLVMFDREGCGAERKNRERLEKEVTSKLVRSGWRDRAAVIVIDPELEQWIWSDDNEVAKNLGWPDAYPGLRGHLQRLGLWPAGAAKPVDPKEAMVRALKEAGRPRSSSIYGQIAAQVGFDRCVDPSFKKLLSVLRIWFPVS